MPENVEVPRLSKVLESFVCYRHLIGPRAHFEGFSHVCIKTGDHNTCECSCGKSWWPLNHATVEAALNHPDPNLSTGL